MYSIKIKKISSTNTRLILNYLPFLFKKGKRWNITIVKVGWGDPSASHELLSNKIEILT